MLEFSEPQNPEMFDPILVPLIKMQPHNSQSSRENATPSRSTYPISLLVGQWRKRTKRKVRYFILPLTRK